MSSSSRATELIETLGLYGIPCSPDQAELLLRHLDLVIEKNKLLNLTRIVDPSEAPVLHIVDSLLPLACEKVSPCVDDSFVDIGTGAGFPGVPLGIMTGAQGLLIDSVGKKVTAVNEFIQALGLSALRAEHLRIEEVPKERLGSFSYVFARAVAQSNVLIEYATPLLRRHGLLVLEKANPADDEMSHARKAATICGLDFVSRETFELPSGLGHREVLIYQKVKKPQIKLPRRTGMAKQSPLGE